MQEYWFHNYKKINFEIYSYQSDNKKNLIKNFPAIWKSISFINKLSSKSKQTAADLAGLTLDDFNADNCKSESNPSP